MRIDVAESGSIRVREAFVGLLFETEEGHQYGICMRDDTIEVTPVGDAPMPLIMPDTTDRGDTTTGRGGEVCHACGESGDITTSEGEMYDYKMPCPTCGGAKGERRHRHGSAGLWHDDSDCRMAHPRRHVICTDTFHDTTRTNDPQSCERIATPTSPDHATTGEAE